jgi:hypothetical protein
MFQAVLIGVILYLVACYVYGLYLLAKLYASRRSAGPKHGRRVPQQPVNGPLLHPSIDAGHRGDRASAKAA